MESEREVWVLWASAVVRKRWFLPCSIVMIVRGQGYETKAAARQTIGDFIAQLEQEYGQTLRSVDVHVHRISVPEPESGRPL